MSIWAIAAVWRHSKAERGDLLTLLAIADYAHDDGRDAWPSIDSLCKKTRLSERGVRYSLGRLVELGELQIEYGGGRKKPNRYAILLPLGALLPPENPAISGTNPATPAPIPKETLQSDAQTLQSTTLNPATIAPNPTRNLQEPSGETPLTPQTPEVNLFGAPIGFVATIEFRPKRGPVEKLLTYEEMLPDELRTDAILPHYRAWVVKRREKFGARDALDEAAARYCIQSMLLPLVRRGQFKPEEIIEAAVAGGWKGFYEPKHGTNGTDRISNSKSNSPADRARHGVTPERFSEISQHHKERAVQRDRAAGGGGAGPGAEPYADLPY